MNPWLNVVCIVVVLCIQDYFGMGTVAGKELKKDDGGNIFSAIRDLYLNLGRHIIPMGYTIEGLEQTIFSKDVDTTQNNDLGMYVNWAKRGAMKLANANNSDQGKEVQDQIEEVKSKLLEKIPESRIPGAAASINKVLDTLNFALSKCITMEAAETEGTKLNKKERALVYAFVSFLYYDVKKELKTEIEGFTLWEKNELNFRKEGDLDRYVKWVKSGAIMLADANISEKIKAEKENEIQNAQNVVNPDESLKETKMEPIILGKIRRTTIFEKNESEVWQKLPSVIVPNEKLDARLEETINEILTYIPEDAAYAINTVLDDLKSALNDGSTIEEVETKKKINK